MIAQANIALVIGTAATVAKAFGYLPMLSWEVVTWPIWGTILLVFVFGFFERHTAEEAS